jgi:hypothetical protein
MRHRSIAIAAIGMALLSGAAMAQGNGKPRFDVGDQGNTAFGATLPTTPGSRPDWNYGVGASMPTWSSNPGTFNSQTAEPGFVDHSHGRP